MDAQNLTHLDPSLCAARQSAAALGSGADLPSWNKSPSEGVWVLLAREVQQVVDLLDTRTSLNPLVPPTNPNRGL